MADERPKGGEETPAGAFDATVPSLRPPELPTTPAGTMVVEGIGETPQGTLIEQEQTRRIAPAEPAPNEDVTRDGAPVFEAADDFGDLRGRVLARRYELIDELSRGGMGVIYIGKHLSLEVPIAVKLMLPRVAKDPHWLRRFEREARATSRLSHRNIVRVLDFGVDEGHPFIVMEHLQGKPLSVWLEDKMLLPTVEELDTLLQQVFDALEAAHNAGIIHRDLKPDNIFLATEADGKQLVKIIDFGLAYMDDTGKAGSLTEADMVSGTPEYMSPEQCRSLKVTIAADIYSLGCILTELLQGLPPFRGKTHMDILTKQMFYEPEPLKRGERDEPLPPLLERLRLDMLAKRITERPATIAEVRERWNEAISPERNAERLPDRKHPEVGGGRAQRLPNWSAAEAKTPTPSEAPAGAGRIGLVRLANDERGVDELCLMALRVAKMRVVPVADAANPGQVDVVVVDAGAAIDEACTWLADLGAELRPIVCVAELSTEDMNRLIAAGASEVVPYPVAGDDLKRKLQRQLRRAARDKR